MSEVKIQEAATSIQQQPQRQMVPCEVDLFMQDKVNEKIVTIDQPQFLPNGMLHCHCGDKIIIYNVQNLKRAEIRAIPQEEKRIIS